MKKEVVEVSRRSYFDVVTIILGVLMFVLPLVFFFLLDQSTGEGFGLAEILFSLVFAILVTFFLKWVKIMIIRNPYLGVVIGLIALGTFEYSLFFKFKGPFTTVFAIVGAIIVVLYVAIQFWLHRREEKHNVDEFDDSL